MDKVYLMEQALCGAVEMITEFRYETARRIVRMEIEHPELLAEEIKRWVKMLRSCIKHLQAAEKAGREGILLLRKQR